MAGRRIDRHSNPQTGGLMLILISQAKLAKPAADLALTAIAFGETVDLVLWSAALEALHQQEITTRLAEFGIDQLYILSLPGESTSTEDSVAPLRLLPLSAEELRSKILASDRIEAF